MLKFKCGSCKKEIVTEDNLAGQQGECPFCQKVVTAPGKTKVTEAPASDTRSGRDVPRCPKCGARRKDKEKTCAFCGAAMSEGAAPKTRRVSAAAMEAASGLDRRHVFLGGGLLAVLVCIVLGYFIFGGEDAPSFTPDELCRRQMIGVYDAMDKGDPTHVGSQFWIEALKKVGVRELRCPSKNGKGKVPGFEYRGPAKPFPELTPQDIFLVCHPGNHPEGTNVLHRNGDIGWAPLGSEPYKHALAVSKD